MFQTHTFLLPQPPPKSGLTHGLEREPWGGTSLRLHSHLEVSTIRMEAVCLPLILLYVPRLKTVLGYSPEQTEDQ